LGFKRGKPAENALAMGGVEKKVTNKEVATRPFCIKRKKVGSST